MESAEVEATDVQLTVENVGGIERAAIEFEPGVTLLAGRNATNRTSLLQAIMAALGSENVSLKADADRGSVEMIVDGDTYTRELYRENGTVRAAGDPLLDDPTLADLFAFLLESNEARRTVALGGDLREIIMRPVDTDAIKSEIDRLDAEKRGVDRELDELEAHRRRLPELEERQMALEQEIEETREKRAAKEEELDARSATVEESREETAEVEGLLSDLRDARSQLEDVRFDLETQRESVESLRAEREEFDAKLERQSDRQFDDPGELETELDRLRGRRRAVESTVSQLQTIVRFNEGMLEGTNRDVLRALRGEEQTTEAVTDQLLADSDTAVCWTCGTEVETADIESTVSRLDELRREKRSRRNELDDEIDELQEEKRSLEEQRRERERVERQLERVDGEIAERERRVEELIGRRQELEATVEELEGDVEARESGEFDEILDLHRDANRLEFEHGRLQGELEDLAAEIDEIEAKLETRDELETSRDEITDELTDLRTRIERIERNAVDQFNDHMETILELLEYRNVERIWIERTETDGRHGRRDAPDGRFTLHVVRTTASGATYEDTFEHLSESEREVTALVFALAGFLVHDVHEVVPFMLLDSLEAIDADRIASLVDYFRSYVPYLVVALLPADAAALPDDFRRIREI